MTWTRLTAYGGAGVVGAVAAVVSFGHLRAVALSAGEGDLAAALLPVSVDGLLVSSAAVMVADRGAGTAPRMSARVAFGIGCVATVGGNIASATPTPLGWAVAGWAPLALLLVTEVLVRTGKEATKSASNADTTAATAGHARRTSRRTSGRTTAASKVARAAARAPDASVAELARLAGVSARTVRRHNGHQSATTVERTTP